MYRSASGGRSTVMCFFFQAEDGIRDYKVTGVQTCALPISPASPSNPPSASVALSAEQAQALGVRFEPIQAAQRIERSEEHTSELQSPCNLVCRLLLEKKNNPLLYQ